MSDPGPTDELELALFIPESARPKQVETTARDAWAVAAILEAWRRDEEAPASPPGPPTGPAPDPHR